MDIQTQVTTTRPTDLAELLSALAIELGLHLAPVKPGTKVVLTLACLEGVSGA